MIVKRWEALVVSSAIRRGIGLRPGLRRRHGRAGSYLTVSSRLCPQAGRRCSESAMELRRAVGILKVPLKETYGAGVADPRCIRHGLRRPAESLAGPSAPNPVRSGRHAMAQGYTALE